MDKGDTYVRIVQASSIFVFCGVLLSGLWPFHAPRNQVTWLKNQTGLRFGGHGSVVSRNPFRAVASQNATSCSLEIWLTPRLATSQGTILAFDSSPDPRLPFSLRQAGSSIAIQRYMIDAQGVFRRPWLDIDYVFRAGERVLLTITSGKGVTAVYVDGVLTSRSSTLGLVSKDLTGHLVLANSTVDESWPGDIAGLATYDRELTPPQVERHFESWKHAQKPTVSGEETPTALYLFNEHDANIVHNEMDPETDLIIPANYFVLHPAFLRPLRDQLENAVNVWGYWRDIAVNVAGFIPVGFVFMAYFSSRRTLQRPALVVLLVGFAMSFTIEALQRFLPTRESGMTDLITNTAGTAVGVVLYRFYVQSLGSKINCPAICLHEDGGIRSDTCQLKGESL